MFFIAYVKNWTILVVLRNKWQKNPLASTSKCLKLFFCILQILVQDFNFFLSLAENINLCLMKHEYYEFVFS